MSVDAVRLEERDCRLLAARYAEHGNSVRRMAAALAEAESGAGLERLRALRRLERRFRVDLGSLCHRWLHRGDEGVHPLEERVLAWVAEGRLGEDGRLQLTVFLDRLRELRDFMSGDLSASLRAR